MPQINWTDSLAIGIPLIDDQHKTWITRLNAVAAAIASHQGPDQVALTLGFLIEYTQFHFATEEKHMTANAYPELEQHRARHDELRTTLDNLVQDFEEEGPTHSLADAVNTFLGNWLTNHIEAVDQRFGAFLKDKGITLSATGVYRPE